ncbi:MAG: response regulator [Gemmatimonadetes bacterium]|nr:response regulator [Gemmatimonadota bacterium]
MAESSIQALTILMVEDEAALRRLVTTVLERQGFRVLSAESATDALVVAQRLETSPDLVVTDLLLPGGSGLRLVARLRERWPDLPVIVVSGHPEQADEIPAGFAFLAKPFGTADLVAAVHEALDR